jgi:CheY-like chemotaxis protein
LFIERKQRDETKSKGSCDARSNAAHPPSQQKGSCHLAGMSLCRDTCVPFQERPLHVDLPDGLPSQSPNQVVTPSGPLVAVLDDEESIHRLLSTLLRAEGFNTLHATSTSELIANAAKQVVDAFVIDLRLGAESGIELLTWLRRQPRYIETPAMVFTGVTELTEAEELAIRQQRAYIFYKVQTPYALIEYLHRLLRRS